MFPSKISEQCPSRQLFVSHPWIQHRLQQNGAPGLNCTGLTIDLAGLEEWRRPERCGEFGISGLKLVVEYDAEK